MEQMLPQDTWSFKNSKGRPRKYSNPVKLWNAAVLYFEWVRDHPVRTTKYVMHKAHAYPYIEEKPRAMLLSQFFGWIGITRTTWEGWKDTRPDLLAVMEHIESTIWEQKFQYAAANALNANLVSLELGLKTKFDIGPSIERLEDFLGSLEPDQQQELDL